MRFNLNQKLSSPRVKARGFTLIELLVAMVVTALMLTLVMASYWTFLQTQQRMAMSRELQSEVRFALNRFADKVRASRIDYDAYSSGNCASLTAAGSSKLCLAAPNGEYYFFEHKDLNSDGDKNALVMGLGTSNGNSLADSAQPLISPNKFNITKLNFAFSPADNPNSFANPQMQPKVTLFLTVSPTNETYQDLVIENQTTISSRQY